MRGKIMGESVPVNRISQPTEPRPDAAANPTNSRGRRSPWPAAVLGSLILAYAIIWVCLAAPYRPFPGDDGRLWGHMIQGKWMSVRDGFEPVAEISLRAFRWVGTLFVARSPGLLVASVATWYAGILVILASLGWRWSGK